MGTRNLKQGFVLCIVLLLGIIFTLSFSVISFADAYNTTDINVSIESVGKITLSPNFLNWSNVEPGSVAGTQTIEVSNIGSLNVTDLYAYMDTLTVEICEGDTLELYGELVTEAGAYTDSLLTISGCDSIEVTIVELLPVYVDTTIAVICEGETWPWHDSVYVNKGIYYDTLTTVAGCDSIGILLLDVISLYGDTTVAVICEGDSLLWGSAGESYTETGWYYDTLLSQEGCDSIAVLDLTTLPGYEEFRVSLDGAREFIEIANW